MNNSNLIRLLYQSIKLFKLDLSDYNILLPALPKGSSLAPLIASLSGAKNIYIPTKDLKTMNEVSIVENELQLTSNINFIDKETPQILSNLDIVIKGQEISPIDKDFISSLKKNCVISILPKNLDFNSITDINLNDCAEQEIPVISVNPSDQTLMLYKYISNLIIKRCYEADLSVFRSRILLVGSGELLENTLSLLKTVGAQVYVAYTNRPEGRSYVLKHLPEIDAIIVADNSQKSDIIIGKDGFIKIEDLVEINPDIKIIHFSGKIEPNTIEFSRIFLAPKNISQNSFSISPEELSLKVIADVAAAAIKAAECVLKARNRTLSPDEIQVSYSILNADGPIILGRVMF